MKFSIIIPTFNEAQSIEKCLFALQKFRADTEIILVDGGSDDETVNLAKPLVDTILNSEKGRANQMNCGANAANGEMLIFLHADTFLPENALTLISENRNDAIWGRFDMRLIGSHFMLGVISQMMNWRSRFTKIATGDQAIFVKKSVFHELNGYAKLALMEDIELCKRLKKRDSPLCLNAKVESSARRWEEFGVFKIILLMWRLRLGYFLGENPETLAQIYKLGQF
jgi:rSAM/selenodomain-associated transferase 2